MQGEWHNEAKGLMQFRIWWHNDKFKKITKFKSRKFLLSKIKYSTSLLMRATLAELLVLPLCVWRCIISFISGERKQWRAESVRLRLRSSDHSHAAGSQYLSKVTNGASTVYLQFFLHSFKICFHSSILLYLHTVWFRKSFSSRFFFFFFNGSYSIK